MKAVGLRFGWRIACTTSYQPLLRFIDSCGEYLTLGKRVGLTIAFIGFYPLDYQYLSREFLTATVHLVFFLAIIRILTAKTNRDYLYTAIIALLELLAAALLSIQLNFFLFLGSFLLFAIATLTSGEIRRAIESLEPGAGQI